MTTKELMLALKERYDGRKVYYQKWHKGSIRIAFRKYKDEKKQFEQTVRFYKNLIYSKYFPISTFTKIYLISSKGKWFIELELAKDGWVEEVMKEKGYSHPAEVIPDVGVFRNGGRIDDEFVFDNAKLNKEVIKLMSIRPR